jgi:hypothetical protein
MDRTTRTRLGIAAIVAVVVLFAIELVALATGQALVASLVAVVFVVGWFVLRRVLRNASPR